MNFHDLIRIPHTYMHTNRQWIPFGVKFRRKKNLIQISSGKAKKNLPKFLYRKFKKKTNLTRKFQIFNIQQKHSPLQIDKLQNSNN